MRRNYDFHVYNVHVYYIHLPTHNNGSALLRHLSVHLGSVFDGGKRFLADHRE